MIKKMNNQVYKMPVYRKLEKNTKAYKQALQLKTLWNQFGIKNFVNTDVWRFLDKCRELEFDSELIESIESIFSSVSNYGDYYRFEFPLKNLMMDDTGNLILLDICFNSHAYHHIENLKNHIF